MKKILSLCSILMLFACSNKAVSLDGEYKMLNAPENAEITIGFEGDRYFGQSAVNRYFGSFEKEGDKIKFGPAGATMMAGPEENMKAESAVLGAIAKVASVKADGENLLLLDEEKNVVMELGK